MSSSVEDKKKVGPSANSGYGNSEDERVTYGRDKPTTMMSVGLPPGVIGEPISSDDDDDEYRMYDSTEVQTIDPGDSSLWFNQEEPYETSVEDANTAVPVSVNDTTIKDDTHENGRSATKSISAEGKKPSTESIVSNISPDRVHKAPAKAIYHRERQAESPSGTNSWSYEDHFTLKTPSSTLRIRNARVHVYEQRNKQFIIEVPSAIDEVESSGRKNKVSFRAKRMDTSSVGLNILRSMYTIVAFIVTAFLFVFSSQILLYIFLDVAIYSGRTSFEPSLSVVPMISAVLSIPLLITALSFLMTSACHFIRDCWGGHHFMRTLFGTDQLITEWSCVFAFVMIPGVTCIGALFASSPKWWEITLMTWFCSVMALFLIFAVAIIVREVQESFYLHLALEERDRKRELRKIRRTESNSSSPFDFEEDLRRCAGAASAIEAEGGSSSSCEQTTKPSSSDGNRVSSSSSSWRFWANFVLRALLRRQKAALHGVQHSSYLAQSAALTPLHAGRGVATDVDDDDEDNHDEDDDFYVLKTLSRRMGLYSKIVSSKCVQKCCFTKVFPPIRLYSADEVLGSVPLVTRHTWSLEKFFCRPSSNLSVTVVTGPYAVQKRQVVSSLVCGIVGNIIIILIVASFLSWLDFFGWFVALLVVIIGLAILIPFFISERQNIAVFKDIKASEKARKEKGNEEKESESAKEASASAQDVARAEEMSFEDEDGGSNDDDVDAEDDGIFRVYETHRICEASDWLCWTKFVIELLIFFLWPVLYLFISGSIAMAFVFLFGGFMCLLRYSFSVRVALEELGPIERLVVPSASSLPPLRSKSSSRALSSADDNTKLKPLTDKVDEVKSMIKRPHRNYRRKLLQSEGTTTRNWKKRARLAEIVRKIGRRGMFGWGTILLIFTIVYFLITLSASRTTSSRTSYDTNSDEPSSSSAASASSSSSSSSSSSVQDNIALVTNNLLFDFVYEPQPGQQYPTCQLQKGLHLTTNETGPELNSQSDLIDYGFLSWLPYIPTSELTQLALDAWFGIGVARDREDLVELFRAKRGSQNSPVSYRLITFPSVPNFGVVCIRGTQSSWDFLADAHLWSATALSQGVRTLTPIGELLTPVLKYLVRSVTVFQSPLAKEMRFYRETTDFVLSLKYDPDFGDDIGGFDIIHLAGHSLGGGLAIISGAQTQSPTVAMSGVNAMITSLTLDPQVTPEQLNTFVFNIVPDRDPIARIDDLADLYQRVRCTAPANDPFSCHSSVRTVCEIMYQCGSAQRPPICACSLQFGYPEPIPIGNRTFDEACANAGKDTSS